jgi:alpha-ketoglutarate-dependent taurine dioxygenase
VEQESVIKLNYLSGQEVKDQVKHLLLFNDQPVLIQDFVLDDQVYSSFINGISNGVFHRNPAEPSAIFEVKVTRNQSDFFSFATSHYGFPNHTDCSDADQCPTGMALLCIKRAETGGQTTITPLSAVLNSMEESLKHQLLTHPFQFRNIVKPILEYKHGAYRIRYSRIMIESYQEALPFFETELLDQLDTIISQYSYTISLKEGDLLLLRNDRFLHGRMEFAKTSQRLMKRIRFNV